MLCKNVFFFFFFFLYIFQTTTNWNIFSSILYIIVIILGKKVDSLYSIKLKCNKELLSLPIYNIYACNLEWHWQIKNYVTIFLTLARANFLYINVTKIVNTVTKILTSWEILLLHQRYFYINVLRLCFFLAFLAQISSAKRKRNYSAIIEICHHDSLHNILI
jgi:hypothetical protein